MTIDQEPPLPQIQLRVDRAAAARFGINVADVATIIESGIGGKAISNVFIGERVYDIAVRFPGERARKRRRNQQPYGDATDAERESRCHRWPRLPRLPAKAASRGR